MARRSEIEQSMLGRFLAFKRQKHSHRPLNSSPSMHGASAIIKTKRRISKISNEIDHCLHRISGRRSIRLPASKISKLLRCIDARVVEHKQAVSALHKLAPHSQLHAVRPYIKRRKQSKLERTGPDLVRLDMCTIKHQAFSALRELERHSKLHDVRPCVQRRKQSKRDGSRSDMKSTNEKAAWRVAQLHVKDTV